MLCLCTPKLDAMLQASASLSAQLSGLGPMPALPTPVVSFMAAASASANASAQLSAALPGLGMNGSLAALATLTATAQAGLGLNLAIPANQSLLASLCAQLNVSALAPLAQVPQAQAAQLSALLSAVAQLNAMLGVNLLAPVDPQAATAFQAQVTAAVHAAVAAHTATQVGAPALNMQAMEQAQVAALLHAAFGAMLNSPSGLAQLSAMLSALASLNLPPLGIPPGIVGVAACLQVMAQAGLLAQPGGLPNLLALLSARLNAVASIIASATATASASAATALPPLPAPPAINLAAMAQIAATLPVSLPAVTSGLPAVMLMASLNAAAPIVAASSCGACRVFDAVY